MQVINLIRKHDNLTKVGFNVKWIRWNDDGTFKELCTEAEIGCSCALDLTGPATFTWMTTPITKIISSENSLEKNYVIFETENSTYTLTITEGKIL